MGTSSRVFRDIHADFPLRRPFGDMLQRVCDDFLHGLRLFLQHQPPILQTGEIQDVLHQRTQPVGVVPDLLGQRVTRFR